MGEDIKLNKEVFDKRIYQKTIDTSFNELGVKPIQDQLDAQPTVEEFFNLYNELFYQIDELGSTNSHEYLVKTSGEYISFEEKDELVEALQREIANLRKELLQAQQDLADALTPEEVIVEPIPEIEEEPIENPILNIVTTPEPEAPTTPAKTANPEDTKRYNAGWKKTMVSYSAMDYNLVFFSMPEYKSYLPEKLGNEDRDLGNIRKKDITSEATWETWAEKINKRSSGKETANLRKVLEYTVNRLRHNFVTEKEFGNGFITSNTEIIE